MKPDKAAQLLSMIRGTRDQEMTCDEFLVELAALVEARLMEVPLSAVFQEAVAHLDNCGDCREEYEILQAAVKSLED